LSQVKLDLISVANVIAMRTGNYRLRFIPLDYYDRLKYPSEEVYDTIMEYRMSIPELCRWIGHYMD
jgi:5-hydroxyisourate hydrolase-like protein (transthyretin family)